MCIPLDFNRFLCVRYNVSIVVQRYYISFDIRAHLGYFFFLIFDFLSFSFCFKYEVAGLAIFYLSCSEVRRIPLR